MRIVILGNFSYPYTSENHHLQAITDLGHDVIPIQEGTTTAGRVLSTSRGADALVWVHTHGWETPGGIVPALRELRRNGTPTIAYHLDLWMGLRREADLVTGHPYLTEIDRFFSVDPAMAEWVTENTSAIGTYLPAAVAHRECWMAPSKQRDLDVVFVGSHRYHSEWPYRNELISRLSQRYSGNFWLIPGAKTPVRGAALNRLYSHAKVVIGDTLCPGFDYPGYFSDRVFETTGRGGFLIHPRIPGLETHFVEDQELVFYDFNDWPGLFDKIDYYLDPVHAESRDAIRIAGHLRTHRDHTYLSRWQSILDTL